MILCGAVSCSVALCRVCDVVSFSVALCGVVWRCFE